MGYNTETKVLTISGTGTMSDFDWQTGRMRAPWIKNSKIYDYLETVVISDGVTSIGEHAFYYCESLKNITIPSSVKSIGKSAFSGCYISAEQSDDGIERGLEEVIIQDGV